MRNIVLSLILAGTFLSGSVAAQTPDGLSCATALPFCSDSSYYFPNFSDGDGVTAPVGPDYGCLGSEPNPIWYYMQIGTSGTIELTVSQTDLSGAGIDVDFAMWGPFTDLAAGCDEVMSGTLPPLQCSYSSAAIETIGLGLPGGFGAGASTPPAAVAGEIYVIILTNYSGEPGNISFEQTDGTGSTDCSIINCGLAVSNTGPVCEYQSVTLNAENLEDIPGSTVSYNWTGPGGFTSALQNPSVLMSTVGDIEYTCTLVVTLDGESDTCIETTTVTVHPVYEDITTTEICAGEIYNFHGGVYTSTGAYTVPYATAEGCDSNYMLNLTVHPKPNVDIGASELFICEGDESIIGAQQWLSSNTYQWLKNGSVMPGLNTHSISVGEAGEYRMVVTTDKGCIDTSRSVTITVYPPAEVDMLPVQADLAALCIGDTIHLAVAAKSGYEYRWSPEQFFRHSSGFRSSEADAVVMEPAYIKVTAFNEYGCRAYDSVWVNPAPCCFGVLPTAFSPNNDGLNDYFNIMLDNLQEVVVFQVFDRYGSLVYDNTDRDKGWDGTYSSGEPAAQGVYYYRVVYSCTDKENYEQKGDVLLVR